MKWANLLLSNILKRLVSIFPYLTKVIDTTDPSSFGRFASLLSLLIVILFDVVRVTVGTWAFLHGRVGIREILPTPAELMSETGFALAFYTASKGLDVVKNYGGQKSDDSNDRK